MTPSAMDRGRARRLRALQLGLTVLVRRAERGTAAGGPPTSDPPGRPAGTRDNE
jgi:hypothetical protein